MSSAWGRGCVGFLLSVLHTWIQQNILFLPETHWLAPLSLWLRRDGPGFRWDHACKVCPPTRSGHPTESLFPSVLAPLIIAHWGEASHHPYVQVLLVRGSMDQLHPEFFWGSVWRQNFISLGKPLLVKTALWTEGDFLGWKSTNYRYKLHPQNAFMAVSREIFDHTTVQGSN